jgi:hypothetical protein
VPVFCSIDNKIEMAGVRSLVHFMTDKFYLLTLISIGTGRKNNHEENT